MLKLLRSLGQRLGLYEYVAFAAGFALMAFELAASRILAPAIGTSTYVWTSVIGVMIAALAGGYAAGGWAADRRTEQQDLIWLLLGTAVAILLTCLIYQSLLDIIGSALHDPRLQGVAASALLFAPASFLMGMISPYLARLRVRSVQTTGRSVAGLSAANSVGGIAGTFCTGFVFFTIIGSRATLALVAGILIAVSWGIMPRLQRRGRIIASIGLGAVLLMQFVTPASAAVASIDTPTSHYKIANVSYHGRPVRVLITGPGGWQSGIYLDGHPKDLVFSYTRKLADVVAAAPHKQRILILGGGAFTLPEYLGRQYPQAEVDVVEIDPKLPDIARRYFQYSPPANVHTYTQDARTYLQHTTTRYDVIIADVYNDSSVPFTLATTQYTAALRQALQSDGVVAANIIGAASAACMPLLASVHASYAAAFQNNLYYPLYEPTLSIKQNIIAVYSNASLAWANDIPGSALVSLSPGQRLTDDFAPVESLKQRCR